MADTPITPSERAVQWAETMQGTDFGGGIVGAHKGTPTQLTNITMRTRQAHEELERLTLSGGATLSEGAGVRGVAEQPDDYRTCFARDRDRILGSTSFRRLSGKTQVVVFPTDHQRTRLTHALEVAQVSVALAQACGLNVNLAEAIALGHDCGHGPGGHASEDAFDVFLPEGYHHAVWGADVMLAPLNLCVQTLDGIRNHSWSRPRPATPEGEVVALADRFAYCAHDLEDAISVGVVSVGMLPEVVTGVLGVTRRSQLNALITDVVTTVAATGHVAMSAGVADALAELRRFNYDYIYMRPASLKQSDAVIPMLRALVEFYTDRPGMIVDGGGLTAAGSDDAVRLAVEYVAGMTDRFACDQAVQQLGWKRSRLPKGIDLLRR